MSTPDRIRVAAVLGAGTMGHGIAQVCAAAGVETRLFDVKQELVDAGLAKITKNLDKGVARGKVTEEAKATTLGNLSGTADFTAAVTGATKVIRTPSAVS